MWGQCRGQAVTTPAETPFHSLHDVFACFASPAVTWKPMELDVVLTNKVSDSVRLSFDEEETSDLKFNVDGKLIHVHKSILKIRCEHFRSMFQAHWGEDEKRELEDFCFGFALNHLTAVAQTEAFNKLDEPTIKILLTKLHDMVLLNIDNDFELGLHNIFVSKGED
ncbi:RCC1 and BTB domain-containing protein 1 [Caerostris extrusa]|uniref:RCC1 and BTB domain-containing protein 1 n=1 Tax=Caerostris extrusa TaxID=172846 RepID=A0AAV4XVS2_CAEEX|nr:RCC1 and BTB domain-containing protein 1 [Caerostris extrusa]